jgi:hypothetical protein
MSEILSRIKSGLEKVQDLKKRRSNLESEQGDLQTKIEKLTGEVAGGNAQAVASLTIAKARLESALPAELARCDAEMEVTIGEIRTSLVAVGPAVARAYGAEERRVTGLVTEFLEQHIQPAEFSHYIGETAREIASRSKSVRKLDGLRSMFNSITFQQSGATAAQVVFRAQSAIENLANVI